MRREILITKDGSTTIHMPELDEQYHSKHGAIQEAYHVFLKMGLFHYAEKFSDQQNITVLEMGFGTGLNAFITLFEAQKRQITIHYKGIDAFPVSAEEITSLNYVAQLNAEAYADQFLTMHAVSWEEDHRINNLFSLRKEQKDFTQVDLTKAVDIVYFDAFGARVHPEAWTEEIFRKMFSALKSNGVLVTYAAKGSVRRAMQAVGFVVERLPGPPGKREMLRATKP
ncbi:tRNA (5-methylaminomethyl-2-thiouridine)(34)-methyltransferase MnmD [Gangjinia marincola]|uniref:tRNA (5-methylaminomethyl-2-thiouridine)(34)-methyltransferase MnmD n=1 Tax=Gangjinia marincola TaxID=578463 RepID=A0ABP3XUK1_9FLAO